MCGNMKANMENIEKIIISKQHNNGTIKGASGWLTAPLQRDNEVVIIVSEFLNWYFIITDNFCLKNTVCTDLGITHID